MREQEQRTRRTADILAGFDSSAWGGEYLTFNVGNNGSSNDSESVTDEKVRITSSGYVGIGTTPVTMLDISGSAASTDGHGILNITNTSSASFEWSITNLNPNMGSGDLNDLLWGQALSTNNTAYFGFKYVSSGSTNNKISLGFIIMTIFWILMQMEMWE